MTKFEPDEYRHKGNAVCLLNYHFVCIPKRRRKVLVGKIAERLQEIICDVCNENRWRSVAMEIMPDHVHLFLNVRVVDASADIIRFHQRQSIAPSQKRISRTTETTYLVDA